MTFLKEYSGLVALVILAIMGLSSFGGSNGLLGSTACDQITCLAGGLRLVTDTGGDFESDVAAIFTSTFKLGASGTAQSNQVITTCSPIANVSAGATSTAYAYCTGVTGLTSSDKVFGTFASSTAGWAVTDNWAIINAKASTTAGVVDFEFLNLTGAAAVPSAVSRTASSTTLWITH